MSGGSIVSMISKPGTFSGISSIFCTPLRPRVPALQALGGTLELGLTGSGSTNNGGKHAIHSDGPAAVHALDRNLGLIQSKLPSDMQSYLARSPLLRPGVSADWFETAKHDRATGSWRKVQMISPPAPSVPRGSPLTETKRPDRSGQDL
jgi:hypothetical protein